LAFLLVYLIGFYNLDTRQALDQFGKGMVKFVLHFLFLVTAVAYVVRGGLATYWRALGFYVGGMAANAVYGVLQLLAAPAGGNLDSTVLKPLTGGESAINVYGAVNGASVYRPNALTGDPNHLGIMLLVPLLVLLPVYLRLERGHRFKLWLGLLLAFLLVVELATLSRSGLLGLALGGLLLAVPYRRFARSRTRPAGCAGAPAGVGNDGRARRHDGRERLLPDDVLLLLLRVRRARGRGAGNLFARRALGSADDHEPRPRVGECDRPLVTVAPAAA